MNAASLGEAELIHEDSFETGANDPVIIALSAEVLADGTGDALISNGLPFAKGKLTSTDVLALFADGTEVAIHVNSLANWPEGSVRSVLIQFPWPRADLPRTFQVHIGNARTTIDLPVTSAVDWLWEGGWLGDSSWRQLPVPDRLRGPHGLRRRRHDQGRCSIRKRGPSEAGKL